MSGASMSNAVGGSTFVDFYLSNQYENKSLYLFQVEDKTKILSAPNFTFRYMDKDKKYPFKDATMITVDFPDENESSLHFWKCGDEIVISDYNRALNWKLKPTAHGFFKALNDGVGDEIQNIIIQHYFTT